MVLNYDIVVDLTPEFNKQLSPKFSVSLGDHGSREYMARILQSGEPYEIAENSLVSIVGKKPDGHIFAYDCTYSDEYVYFTIEEQMTPVSGIVACELVIIDTDGHKLGSANFTFWVEPCPVSDGEASESDLQMFQEILDAADDLADVREILDRAVPIAEQIGDIDKMLAAFPTESASGELIAFADGADGIPAKKLTLNLSPHQSGSGDPSPDNVRLISGYTSVNVYRSTRNLLSVNATNETKTLNGITIKADNGVYTISGTASDVTVLDFRLASTVNLDPSRNKICFNNNQVVDVSMRFMRGTTIVHYWTLSLINRIIQDWTATANENVDLVQFYIPKESSVNMTISPMILAKDDADTITFEPGKYATYPITFPADAGTVYGGSLEINEDGSGTLTVDRAAADLGSLTWARYGNIFYSNTSPLFGSKGKAKAGGAITCPIYTMNMVDTQKPINNCIYVTNTQETPVLRTSDSRYTDVAEYKTAMSGMITVFELYEPQTYTLTAEQVTTLLGDNTVWMDADGSIALQYRADTQKYIDSRIALLNSNLAFIEDGMTASRAYSVGQFVLIGGQLYKVTSAIASGATFTPGTNVVATTVGTELTALN